MKTAWVRTTLGEIAEIVSGATPKTSVEEYWGGGIPWVTPKELSGLEGPSIASTERTLTEAGIRSCAASLLPPRSVLLSSRAPIGLVAINEVPMATNQGFKSLVPDGDRVDAKFLYWWLRCHRARLEAMGNGATFKEVSKKVVHGVEIDLPALAEQRQIAAVLDAAESLRAMRRQALAKLDELPRVVFHEMFGDPISSESGWPTVPMGELAELRSGVGFPKSFQGRSDGDFPFAKVGDISAVARAGEIDLVIAANYVNVDDLPLLKAKPFPPGTIAFAKIGEAIRKNYRAVAQVPMLFDNNVMGAIPGGQVAHRWFFHFLAALDLFGLAQSTAVPSLRKTELARIEVPLPPLDLQKRFDCRAEAVQRHRGTLVVHARELDGLFGSLQQRAFRGDL